MAKISYTSAYDGSLQGAHELWTATWTDEFEEDGRKKTVTRKGVGPSRSLALLDLIHNLDDLIHTTTNDLAYLNEYVYKIKLDLWIGISLHSTKSCAQKLANQTGRAVGFKFNDTYYECYPPNYNGLTISPEGVPARA